MVVITGRIGKERIGIEHAITGVDGGDIAYFALINIAEPNIESVASIPVNSVPVQRRITIKDAVGNIQDPLLQINRTTTVDSRVLGERAIVDVDFDRCVVEEEVKRTSISALVLVTCEQAVSQTDSIGRHIITVRPDGAALVGADVVEEINPLKVKLHPVVATVDANRPA